MFKIVSVSFFTLYAPHFTIAFFSSNFAINLSRNRKDFIEEEIKPIKFRNCLYRMKLAQYEVEVNCTRKKEGRQLAAQKILKVSIKSIFCEN